MTALHVTDESEQSVLIFDSVDIGILEKRWEKLQELYPELRTPCFVCNHFYECDSDSRHDPLICEYLDGWFVSFEVKELRDMTDEGH